MPLVDIGMVETTLFAPEAVDLFHFALTCSYFFYGGRFYKQTDGLAMGSTLSPAMANIHPSIKFTMEIEDHGKLPFLDVLVYQENDGCLGGHEVCRKLTHTNIYVNASNCHHPAHKRSVLSTLIRRARMISDRRESLREELGYLHKIFLDDGYSPWEIIQAMAGSTTVKRALSEKAKVVLPFYDLVSSKIGRLAGCFDLHLIYHPQYAQILAVPH